MFHLQFTLFEDAQGEKSPEVVLTLKVSDKRRALDAFYKAFETAIQHGLEEESDEQTTL